MSSAVATSAPTALRSPSELCRYIRNSDPAQISLARLEQELLRNDILDQLKLTKRDGTVVAAPSQPIAKIQTIAERLGLSYNDALNLMTQYVRQRHTSVGAQPDLPSLLSFYHQERCQLYLLLAILLQTSGDASHPYCSVARNVISQCGDLLDSVLNRYRDLAHITTPPSLPSPELVRLWADDIVQQQAMLLQIILAHLFAIRSLPSATQITSLGDLYINEQLSGGWSLYTMLSAEGRRLWRTLSALWLQIYLRLMQLYPLSLHLYDPSVEFHAAFSDPLSLDERLFSRLSTSVSDSSPMLLSWAVYLCLTYQSLDRNITLPGTESLSSRHVSTLQNRVLTHLSAAVRLEVFKTLLEVLELIDADHLLDIAALLARISFHELLSALSRSDVQNVIVRALPDYYDVHLGPLYCRMLEGNAELSDRIWNEIEESCQDGAVAPSSFPLFDNAFHRFREVVSTLQLTPLTSVNFAECQVLLKLLVLLAASPLGAERALLVLQAADSSCLGKLQALFGRAVSAGLFNIAHGFLLEFAKFTLRCVSQEEATRNAANAVMLSPDLIDSICIALHSVKLDFNSSFSDGPLVETLLGLLCHVPRFDSAFNRQLQRYALPDLAHAFLYEIDIASGAFRCTNNIIRLLESILLQSEVDLHFPLEDYAHLCNRLIDFVCNDVFVIYLSWRFADDKSRWSLGESVFTLFASLLSSDDLRSQLTLRGQIGHRLAIRLCNESAMHRAMFQPILLYRDRLEFGVATRIKDAVSGALGFAFRTIQSLLSVRVNWNSTEKLNESLLDFCFRSGLESAKLFQTIALYLDLPEYQWARHSIVTLTRLVVLSSLMDRPVVTVAGLLSQSRVSELKSQCCRLLAVDVAFLQNAVVEFIVTALKYQPGLAERLLSQSTSSDSDQSCSADHSLITPLHQLIDKKRDDLVAFEQALSVFSQLWLAAVQYRSSATSVIADRVVQEFGESFWSNVVFGLKNPIPNDSDVARLASLQIRSHSFQILSVELGYANDPSSTVSLVSSLPFDIWLQDLLPLPEQWASLSSDIRTAQAFCVTKWKFFMNSVLLNAATTFSEQMRVQHRSILIANVLSLEGIPLSVVKDAAQLLVAIAYHCLAPMSHSDLKTLMRGLQLHADAFETCTRIQTSELSVYALICDSILSVFNLEAIRHHSRAQGIEPNVNSLPPFWADPAVRIGARLAAFDQTGFLSRQLPGLIQISTLSATNEIVGATQALSSHFLSPVRSVGPGDSSSRLKIFLMFVMSICVHPKGSDMLLSIGVLSRISNSWLRSSITEVIKRHSDIWDLILDIATGLIVASPMSPLLHRQIVEFAVVFRQQLQCQLESPLQFENLQQVQRCLMLCYEIGHIQGRFREMPAMIIQEHRRVLCHTGIVLSRHVTSAMYSPPQDFGREQWLALQSLPIPLAFIRSHQAENLTDLFSFDLTARSDPQSGFPFSISFIIDLIDYCVSTLQSSTRLSIPFIKDRIAVFDQLHRFILEHCLFILINFTTYHIRSTAGMSPYLPDYLQEISRIRRSLESAQVISDSDTFVSERVMGPVSIVEEEIQRLVQKAASRNSIMEVDSSIVRWQSRPQSYLLQS